MVLSAMLALLLALPIPIVNTAVIDTAASWAQADPLPQDDDDDELAILSIDDVVVDETDSTATFTVTRTGKARVKVEVDVATSDREAKAGEDYVATQQTLRFLANSNTASLRFTVPIIDNAIAEDRETFLVTLSNPVGAILDKAAGVATIVDDEIAGVAIDADDGIFVVEGGVADKLTIALLTQPAHDVAITIDAPPDQLIAFPAVVTFRPDTWSQAQTVAVTAVPDGIDEVDPHRVPILFSVASDDPGYSSIAVPPLSATIGDADALLVTIDGPTVGATGATATFSAVVNAGGIGVLTYEWAVFWQGDLVAGGDQAVFDFVPDDAGMYIVRALVGDEQNQNPAEFIQFTALGDIAGNTFATDIIWLASEGITTGCNADGTEFCPDKKVTRAQMAAFLVRFLDLTDDGGGNTFTDDDGSIFEDDIAKLAAAGITSGCNPPVNDRFCPGDDVSRGQLAAFLVRALGLTDDGGGNTFTDDDGSIFEDDIAKLAASGITRGCSADGTLFCPEQPVSRGQMAAFLHRANELLP